jgi:predicted RNA-binding Zn-ribbon protein involved in translation (DUF1610 family)
MSELVKSGSRKQIPRRKYLDFFCIHCRSHEELVWRSASGHGRRALIREILMLEGNSHPTFFGEYRIGPETVESASDNDSWEWTCAKCGRPVMDLKGCCPTDIPGIIRCLWEITRRRLEESGLLVDLKPGGDCATDLNSRYEIDSFLFPRQDDESEDSEHTLDLRCPKCGHQEFIERQDAVLFTPVQIVNGALTWMVHERLITDYWDEHETFYHCPKCGFEAPEPFDEWVEHGCRADWEDDF